MLSCGFPSPEACALTCGEQNACPGGFECQPASNRCVPVGTQAMCLGTAITPAQPAGGPAFHDAGPSSLTESERPDAAPQATVGNGGATGESTPDEESGGMGGASGAGSSASGNGGGPPAVNELAIVEESSAPQGSCSGAPLSRLLQASGGVGPYTWRIVQAPPGLQLSGENGVEVELEGEPGEPGSVIVELEDSAGSTTRSQELRVYESPRVATEQLPSLCAGEPYSAVLLASGGNPDEYVWSAELVPAPGQPGSLAELGLLLQGATLSAADSAPIEQWAPFPIALSVRDAHCSSRQLELDVDVVPGDASACPRIRIANPPPLDQLPAPCRGNAYTEAFTVEGGEPPFLWSELSLPPGLHFDAESATLSGISEGDGVLTLELSDANARTIQKSYPVRARDKCWLAYLASESGPARLSLVDGSLLERQPESARRELPAQAGSEGVLDFQFSPDGRFIAYRVGVAASSARLELAALSADEVLPLDFAGAVGEYAWSPDASALAVAFTSGAEPRLGGVLVAGAAPLASTPLAGLPRQLLWTDAEHLAFFTADPELPMLRWLVTAELAGAGFGAPSAHTETAFSDSAQLFGGAGGVFAAEPATGLLEFFASDGGPPTVHAPSALVSPSGAFAGLARDGALQLYRGLDPSFAAAATPLLRADGCTSLLAWASGRERIACAAERAGEHAIALFDVRRAPDPALSALAPLRVAGVPAAAETSGRRRSLSASGSWFALAGDEQLYVVRADGPSPRLWAALPNSLLGTRPGALAFAPDEGWLLIGAGNSLWVVDLEQGPESLRELSASALFDDACSESFLEGRGHWCGSDPVAGPAWSSPADLVAFRSTLGTLELVDLSRLRDGEVAAPVSPDSACSEACRSGDSFRFQP
jgi:hypothetical protein